MGATNRRAPACVAGHREPPPTNALSKHQGHDIISPFCACAYSVIPIRSPDRLTARKHTAMTTKQETHKARRAHCPILPLTMRAARKCALRANPGKQRPKAAHTTAAPSRNGDAQPATNPDTRQSRAMCPRDEKEHNGDELPMISSRSWRPECARLAPRNSVP